MDRTLADDFVPVTALLWARGTEKGEPFDYQVWFSDTYVKMPDGWRGVATGLPKQAALADVPGAAGPCPNSAAGRYTRRQRRAIQR